MKIVCRFIFSTVFVIAFFFISSLQAGQNPVALENPKQKISYGIGLDIGRDIAAQSLDLDHDILLRGISDGLSDKKPLLPEKEIEEVRENFLKERKAFLEKERQELAEKNLKAGKAFLAENSKREGIVTLASGLQYKIVNSGTGATPKVDDNVKVHYRGLLPDGTEFESSYTKGDAAVFPVNRVLPGWTEILQWMREGGKWKIFVPPALAYGEKGAGRLIGPNQVLIFEIELLAIH